MTDIIATALSLAHIIILTWFGCTNGIITRKDIEAYDHAHNR